MKCERCGGTCKVPDWARAGTSNFPNDIPGQRAYLARCHLWFKPAWSAGVDAYHRAKAALAPAAPTFPCGSCGRFAFTEPTTCLWCRGRAAPLASAPAATLPEPQPELSTRQKRRVVEKSTPPEPGLFGDP